MAILGIQRDPTGRGYTIPTEVAASAFGILAGVGGGVAQFIAGSQLAGVSEERISLLRLVSAAGLGIAGTIVGALLVPSG